MILVHLVLAVPSRRYYNGCTLCLLLISLVRFASRMPHLTNNHRAIIPEVILRDLQVQRRRSSSGPS